MTKHAQLLRSTYTDVMRAQERVLLSFLNLSVMEPEKIADFLEGQRIKAKIGNYCECALAEWFRKIVLDEIPELKPKFYIAVQSDEIEIEFGSYGKMTLPVPEGTIRRFMDLFDQGAFPELEEDESDA